MILGLCMLIGRWASLWWSVSGCWWIYHHAAYLCTNIVHHIVSPVIYVTYFSEGRSSIAWVVGLVGCIGDAQINILSGASTINKEIKSYAHVFIGLVTIYKHVNPKEHSTLLSISRDDSLVETVIKFLWQIIVACWKPHSTQLECSPYMRSPKITWELYPSNT